MNRPTLISWRDAAIDLLFNPEDKSSAKAARKLLRKEVGVYHIPSKTNFSVSREALDQFIESQHRLPMGSGECHGRLARC